uniref:Uncharacterized protein n=2 Tax=Timema TaxID=61471 RepID=A0A7R8W2C3_TIMDO|nr:unnamed protein product [Timema douglasi]
MKSLWDGFLSIKKQVKDESDPSDYEEKVVKTEMKHYHYSPEVTDSNPDHFTLDIKSKFKLEPIQPTLSSEIIVPILHVQESSYFNSNDECVQENRKLYFELVHKQENYDNLLEKLSYYNASEYITSKCKTSNCNKLAQVEGHCSAHGEGTKSITESCSKTSSNRRTLHCSWRG